MSFHHTSGAMTPDLHAHHDFPDPRAKVGRRMRFLDFCAAAFLAAAALAVIANVLVFQSDRPALRAMAAKVMTGSSETAAEEVSPPVETAAPVFTSIPLPAARPERTRRTTAAAGEEHLGILTSSTSVSNMGSTLVPVRPHETDVQGLTTPKRISNLRPPANVGDAPTAAGVIRPPQGLPVSDRTRTVQRALAKLGYGPLKVDGMESVQTRQAIQRFQQDRNLPVDGQISTRLMKELSAVSGMKVQ